LMQIDVGYPDRDAERKMLLGTTGAQETKAQATLTADDLAAAQRLVRHLPVGDKVVEAILDLVRSARPAEGHTGEGKTSDRTAELLAWGPGPRASQSLMLAARARALLDGRLAPSVDDVAALALPVLKHRIALTFAARADGETVEAVIARLVARLG
jgi:MoxR-like ATPase